MGIVIADPVAGAGAVAAVAVCGVRDLTAIRYFMALFVVFPLKGMGVAGGWNPKIIVGALILNGAWGLGDALVMSWMSRE
jgi:hypothetical protein